MINKDNMFTDLEKLIDFEQFQELFNALAENKEYNYSENGLTISAKSSDGCTSLQISYEEPKNLAKEEAEDFKNYLESLDDDLFREVCESLDKEVLTRIARCLDSEDVEAVRSGVLRFKKELKEVLVKKINYFSECLNNLDK